MVFSFSDKAGVQWTGQSFHVWMLKANVLSKQPGKMKLLRHKFKIIFGVLQACTTWVLKGMKTLCMLMAENIPAALLAYTFQNYSMLLKCSLALSGTGTMCTNMSKCIKYGIVSHIHDRAIRGPKYYETNFRIFTQQDYHISCPPHSA